MRRRRSRYGMNRTRVIFFAVIALMLATVAVSLSMHVIDASFLIQVYIATTIFSLGVLVIDFLGLLGEHHGDDADGHGHDHGNGDIDTGGHGNGDGHLDMHVDGNLDDFDGASMDHMDDMDHGDDVDHIEEAADDGRHDDQAGIDDVDVDKVESGWAGGPILAAIQYLRMFVYFCLGFGPLGLVTYAASGNAARSLVLAAAGGIAGVVLSRVIYRFRPADTSSLATSDDLLYAKATVTIPITHTDMGRVRAHVGVNVLDLYALAARDEASFDKGDTVEIVRVARECVYVD
jgi:hypothetical protein